MPESAETTRASELGLMRPRDVAAFLGVRRHRSTIEGAGPPPAHTLGRPSPDVGQAEIEAWADQDWWDSKPWGRKG